MTRSADRSDRDIAGVLRAAGSEPAFEGPLDNLATRIVAAAAPLLAARRQGYRPLMWWDYAAEWSRMLVPAGLTVAAASVMMLWIMRPVRPVGAELAPVRGAAANVTPASRAASSTDVIDRAVEELVGSAAAPSPRRPR